jgi:pyruvate,water dikinase
MSHILNFTDAESTELKLVGGKGANLGRLTKAGFPVPPGFTVTTDAYAEALAAGELGKRIDAICAQMHYDDPERLEAETNKIRQLIKSATLPAAVAQSIRDAYREMGDNLYVAVRSSGTAEDLADASFAGLHDTFLDVRGEGAVEEAVRACWASMWTARATAYRQKNDFDHGAAQLAVVIQKMVEPDVAGVLFTGNPLTAATDEILINAAFGLGESVVGGTVTPDEYIVSATDMHMMQKQLGSKATQIVRDRSATHGTEVLELPRAQREIFSLTDSQAVELARLCLKVQDYYGGFPQDIEWAFADGRFYLLQSRPITGVEFSWDAELEETNICNRVDDNWVWTRTFADIMATGGMTPLNYSARFSYGMERCWEDMPRRMGINELIGMRIWKYHKGEIYYNCTWEKIWLQRSTIPSGRVGEALSMVPKPWHGEITAAPFSLVAYLRALLKTHAMDSRVIGIKKAMIDWRTHRYDEVRGKSYAELRLVTDKELKRYIAQQLELEVDTGSPIVMALVAHMTALIGLFAKVLAKWYDGGEPMTVFTRLISGSRERTDTQIENHALWELSQRIRNTDELAQLFRQHQGADFFSACEQSGAGRAFLAQYRPFAAKYAHRGHADRDISFDRRDDNPGLDYPAFQTLLSVKNPVDPEAQEQEVNRRREAALDQVLENVGKKAFGFLRAEAIKILYAMTHDYLAMRDNERQFPNDMVVMSYKRGFVEVGKRLHERGLIDAPRDVFFLGYPEACELLDGHTRNLPLLKAKIAARRRNCERRINGESPMPKYIRRNRAVDMDTTGAGIVSSDGVHPGIPTSPGIVTGRARIIRKLTEIGRVQDGEILVTNSTDPGWTPVFLVIKGVVVETGGALSHASCLAREYGFPAVQLEGAMQLIPDGATIMVDGNTGCVSVIDDGGAASGHSEAMRITA